MAVLSAIYPEIVAGGFPRDHARVNFFKHVRALLPENAAILDFGAGRGKFAELDTESVRRITDIRKSASRFAAFDVDKAVLENIETNDRHWAEIGDRLPFEDESFDLIYSTWVLEHIDDAEFYVGEIERILKPGGWFCALTPNKYGAIAMGARFIPDSAHSRVLRFLVPKRKESDTFPTCYRMNTLSDIRRLFPGWRNGSYHFDGSIGYHANMLVLMRFWRVVQWVTPSFLSKLLMIFVQKPSSR